MSASSIADHLKCPRTLPARLPNADFNPPYPSFSVRFPQNVSQLVMAIIGAQHKSASDAAVDTSRTTLTSFLTSSTCTTPPSFFEWASVTDNKGFYNITAFAYWPSKAAFDSWATDSGFKPWWDALPSDGTGTTTHGWFLEVFLPTTDRFETLFNTDSAREGSAHMCESMSDAVREHGYWGSMRDRIPLSQTDALSGVKAPAAEYRAPRDTDPCGRVRVPGRANLTVIRSGQDWRDTTPEERTLYLETMHPVLEKGMTFLRDHGEEVGCYSCRFMEIVDADSGKADGIDRTFGLAYFDEMASLEGWSKEHPTHLAIFGGFFQYAKKLENNVTLRVFHEVMVLEAEQQWFEYVGCHGGTGMLDTVMQAVVGRKVGRLDNFGDEHGHGEFDVELDDVGEGSELDVSDIVKRELWK
ncbi:heme-containing dehydratase-domain containing protein [Cercophora newfieldiana]|uniref:Heme-containing dehydratase-domain containing protein n=1 Tax=Cercophora newfieldiana TaxID=92897 RepID=A0AA39XTV9_9PEZI|nr:heme-containing dehydratase-domain containing protein [Cercophora newfieldiana]